MSIGFAPMAAHASGGPAITVAPSTGLASGQTVQVSGAGFAANEDVAAVECVGGATDPGQCDLGNGAFATSDGHGRFATPFAVHRMLLTETGFTDCAVSACEMFVASIADFTTDQSTAPIAFDPSKPLPKTTMKVKPSTNLDDLQSVTVSGGGFHSGAEIEVVDCVVANFSCGPGADAEALANGRFSTSITLRREINDSTGARIDCANSAGTCELLAFDPSDADYQVSTPLEFDPNVPPPPPATLKITPNTGLPYYARVSAQGKHWAPNDFLEILECASLTSENCAFIDDLPMADATGRFVSSPMLQRELVDPFDPQVAPVDCAASGAQCIVIVQSGTDGTTVTAPVSFDPNAPIPPPPSATLAPAGPYMNNQVVRIKGRNFAPSASYSVSECASDSDGEVCFGEGTSTLTSPTGGLVTQSQLVRKVRFGGGVPPIDCASSSAQCSLQVESEGGAEVDIALQFAAGGSSSTTPARDQVIRSATRRLGWTGLSSCNSARGPLRLTRAAAACAEIVHRAPRWQS